jgi:CBS domain-containing protein
MDIREIMQREVHRINSGDTLQAAARLMWEGDCGALPVINDSNQVVGMITDRDISMAAYLQGHPLARMLVHEAMSPQLFSVDSRSSIKEAERMMADHQVRRLPVVDEQRRLVGLVSINDLACEYRKGRGKSIKAEQLAETLAAVCTHRPGASVAA